MAKLRYSVFFLIFCLMINNAYAYLDPGTGSILIQGLIAAAVGGLYTIKLYWYKIKKLFSNQTNDAEDQRDDIEGNDTINNKSKPKSSS